MADEAEEDQPEPEPEQPSDKPGGRRWGYVAITGAVAFIALLAFGLVAKGGPTLTVGDEAPDAAIAPLGGGEDVSLSDYRGQWVLLNFWASWCEPCRDEAPAIEDFAKRNRGKVVVVGMDSKENSVDAQRFADEYGLSYELLHDGEGQMMDDYNVKGLPESFLIDPDGEIAYIYRGPVDEQILEQNFAPLFERSA